MMLRNKKSEATLSLILSAVPLFTELIPTKDDYEVE